MALAHVGPIHQLAQHGLDRPTRQVSLPCGRYGMVTALKAQIGTGVRASGGTFSQMPWRAARLAEYLSELE